MSIFRSYSPRLLYESTLRMINAMFAKPPSLDIEPASYFRATLIAHEWMKRDLNNVIPTNVAVDGETTIVHVHNSLVSIEKMLFGTQTPFKSTIKDCCLYTEYLERRLSNENRCTIH